MNTSFRVLCLIAAFGGSVSRALTLNCDRQSLVEKYGEMIQKVAVVDENGRRTEEQYAAEKNLNLSAVQNRFAATGLLKCGNMTLSAQLTGAKNVLTTAAHGFFSSTDCSKKASPESCNFTVKVGSVTTSYRVKKASAIGYSCPGEPNKIDDWAVLILERDVQGVEPYDVPSANESLKIDDPVVSVAAMGKDFVVVDKKTGKKTTPKSIEDCQIKRTAGSKPILMFESNCDSGSGNSGGSILRRVNGRDVLVGITVSNDETSEEEERAIKAGSVNQRAYQAGSWSTSHIPVKRDFIKAVEQATGGQSI